MNASCLPNIRDLSSMLTENSAGTGSLFSSRTIKDILLLDRAPTMESNLAAMDSELLSRTPKD